MFMFHLLDAERRDTINIIAINNFLDATDWQFLQSPKYNSTNKYEIQC